MIKKPIKFRDFDDNEVEEEHYFHLSVDELMRLDKETEGGLEKFLTITTQSGDTMTILAKFREIIGMAYGQRDSGTSFHKSTKITEDFLNSLAYEALFEELVLSGNPDAIVEFINGVVPASLVKQLAASDPNTTVTANLKTLGIETKHVPDPNNLDTGAGTWPNAHNPADGLVTQQKEIQSGLREPFDNKGNLVPWWNREPTERELINMHRGEIKDVYRRKASGWVPPSPE